MLIIPIAQIHVGERFRKEIGDITDLAASVNEVGLIHPIVVSAAAGGGYTLIVGRRRLEAVKSLNRDTIAAHVVTDHTYARRLLRLEQDENVCRKDFTTSERVAIGLALEEIEKAAAKERLKEGRNRGGEKNAEKHRKKQSGELDGNLPSSSPDNAESSNSREEGQTLAKVGQSVGLSRHTYEKAKEVVAAAQENPEEYGDLVQKMDEKGNVSAAHRKLIERRQAAAAEAVETELDRDVDGNLPPVEYRDRNGKVVPPRAMEAFANISEIEKLCREMDRLAREIIRVAKLPGGRHLNGKSAEQQIRSIRRMVHFGIAAFVCPYCKGDDTNCDGCNGDGWLDEFSYRNIPANVKNEDSGEVN